MIPDLTINNSRFILLTLLCLGFAVALIFNRVSLDTIWKQQLSISLKKCCLFLVFFNSQLRFY